MRVAAAWVDAVGRRYMKWCLRNPLERYSTRIEGVCKHFYVSVNLSNMNCARLNKTFILHCAVAVVLTLCLFLCPCELCLSVQW
jgi:hypothetical protein